ncbi:MAG: flagellar biosynthetic protein FliO [Candidatus Hydrogenedentes bacterium]|nr:flagellar biosynthetic protein FliO [Candidatus Hydrogenedentota bacterium]
MNVLRRRNALAAIFVFFSAWGAVGAAQEVDEFIQELIERGAENRGESGADAGGSSSEDSSELPRPPSSMYWMLLCGVAATAFVLGLIVLLGYVARRFGGKSLLLAGTSLGSVIGRIHLDKSAALYYVRTGGRILVVGVTANTVSLVGEFDAVAFDDEDAEPEPESQSPVGNDPGAFLSQLRSSSSSLRSTEEGDFKGDMEIDSLKGDIRRLQTLLDEESRETRP